MRYAWTCHCCGKAFDTLPLDYAAEAPAHWFGLPEQERQARAVLSEDVCTVDGRDHFVRACLEIPVRGLDRPFVWGVWVSLSEASVRRAAELFDADPGPGEPPRFGWLSTALPLYPGPTLNLKAMVHFRPRPLRPRVELEPTGHPLAVEQREGIPAERVREIVARVLHPPRAGDGSGG